MPLTYKSRNEIVQGDRILYHGEAGTVEFIASTEDPETAWYIEKFGRGCMIRVTGFGSVFLSDPENDEDLEFVGRTDANV